MNNICDRITNHYVNITCNPPCPITNQFVPWPNNFVRIDVARNRLVDTIVHVAVRSILASGLYPQTPATVQLKLPSFSRFVHSSTPPIRHIEFDPIEDESTIPETLTTSSSSNFRSVDSSTASTPIERVFPSRHANDRHDAFQVGESAGAELGTIS